MQSVRGGRGGRGGHITLHVADGIWNPEPSTVETIISRTKGYEPMRMNDEAPTDTPLAASPQRQSSTRPSSRNRLSVNAVRLCLAESLPRTCHRTLKTSIGLQQETAKPEASPLARQVLNTTDAEIASPLLITPPACRIVVARPRTCT